MNSIVFVLNQQLYALPVACVHEVVLLAALVPLAGAPAHVRGMLNLRGHYVPVVDGRILAGGAATDRLNNQILIIGLAGQGAPPTLGLLVDQVRAVRPAGTLRPAALPATLAAAFLRGVMADDEESILIMDAGSLGELAGTPAERSGYGGAH